MEAIYPVLFMWALFALGYFTLIMYRKHISGMASIALGHIERIEIDLEEERQAFEFHHDEAVIAEASIEELEAEKLHWQKYLQK